MPTKNPEQKPTRVSTSTSSFGVGRRESHDSSSFYARFVPPELSDDEDVVRWSPEDPFICGDAASMDAVPDNCVALVVTSPPYFVGKEYEQALGEGHVPGTYLDYLQMLRNVFGECKRVLEPGGRIAVNVANLGRRPYRSLSSDVIGILQDDLGLLLRGEVIWVKAEGSSGSCAWGSFRQASNPVLRDTSERVIIASKGRFDRAISRKDRQKRSLPYRSTVTADEFMDATLDVWRIAPERAARVGHPAPFPVELPQRLIELYTYEDDLVLDPFMGSGSTLVAAARTCRRYAGYDMDEKYIDIARQRVRLEGSATFVPDQLPGADELSLFEPLTPEIDDFQARAYREGKAVQDLAEEVLSSCGFEIVERDFRIPQSGVDVSFLAKDKRGRQWHFDVSGAFTTPPAGLLKADTLWKSLGRALVLKSAGVERIVFLTTGLPERKSAGDKALRTAGPGVIFDAIEMLPLSGRERLREYANGDRDAPLVGFWSAPDVGLMRSAVSRMLDPEGST